MKKIFNDIISSRCLKWTICLSILVCLTIQAQAKDINLRPYLAFMNRIKPLHETIHPPQPGDWLDERDEAGQTFQQYLQINPRIPTKQRNKLYIQPIGDFTEVQREVMMHTAEYMGLFFNLKVHIKKILPLSVIPKQARRVHPEWGDKQILSTHILHEILKPQLPNDACSLIALTTSDLWPGKGMNYVFGQASIRQRVGVWSIYRYGDPEESKESYKKCLKRAIKVAVHETGHMFSIRHCTAYECVMCGCNHLVEADKRPIWLCPHDVAKICWATKISPSRRYLTLARFWKKNGFEAEYEFFKKSIDILKPKK